MNALKTLAVAFSMFSAIPMPQFPWEKENMRYALCAFPLVGAVCGALWLAVGLLPLPQLLRAGLWCLIPVWVTGGIHLDGYADVSDALASYGEPEKKRAILHDPHLGAFAAIRLCGFFLLYFCLCTALTPALCDLMCVGLGFLLSRALSGWAIAALPLAPGTGLARSFADAADKKKVRRFLLALALCLAGGEAALGGLGGLAMAVAAVLCLMRYASVAERQFGGISGDLAGWFLVRCELWQLAALVAVRLLEGWL